ncbi:MAG: HIT family protein [Candidatus Accumulibacter sp. 66-26]|nr:HIT family protein [Accumulibacter sp.]OJW50937.1 MAG: HIT family protein [Candidatus Accumulibacter sp. 66-26]
MNCELCESSGGTLVWNDATCRVVQVAEPGYPGFCRVILNHHAREMTDLPAAERQHVMNVVFAVESALRGLYRPEKINLASFGNMTPHVHWHVIPRWPDDRHFPQPVWGTAQRPGDAERPAVSAAQLRDAVAAALGSG